MEDVLTDIPPPTRFFQEDLNNFSCPPPPLPPPSLIFSNPNLEKPLHPSLLIIAISTPSLYVVHHISSKTPIGSIILPETPSCGNLVEPSLKNKSCNIYSIGVADSSVLLVSVQFSVATERAHAIAKLLISEQIVPERVLILDSVQSRNFRGMLSADKTFALKLETSLERRMGGSSGSSSLLKGLDYFPTGSLIEGLAASLLARCQIKKIRGSLCVTWPEYGYSAVALVKSILLKGLLPGVELSVDDGSDFGGVKNHAFHSEMYT